MVYGASFDVHAKQRVHFRAIFLIASSQCAHCTQHVLAKAPSRPRQMIRHLRCGEIKLLREFGVRWANVKICTVHVVASKQLHMHAVTTGARFRIERVQGHLQHAPNPLLFEHCIQ